jgi:hypothetical protein
MTQPAPQPAAPAIPVTTTITTTAKKTGSATDFVQRMLGPTETKALVPAGRTSYMQAAGHALGDGLTVGTTGAVLGAAHAKGWLDMGGVAVDGVLGLFGLAVSVAAAPHSPTFSRIAGNVGLAGLATVAFRKAFKLTAGREMSADDGVVSPKAGQDRIATVAADLDL